MTFSLTTSDDEDVTLERALAEMNAARAAHGLPALDVHTLVSVSLRALIQYVQILYRARDAAAARERSQGDDAAVPGVVIPGVELLG